MTLLKRSRLLIRVRRGRCGAHRGVGDERLLERQDVLPDAVVAEADSAKPMGLKGREDLRELPLIILWGGCLCCDKSLQQFKN